MSRPRALLLLALLLVVGTFLVYAPIGAHDWVAYDDPEYVTNNPHVQGGFSWSEARWVFTHPYQANYHPLTWIAHMLDVELHGLAPAPHHWTSVALHAGNAVLVLLLLATLVESTWAAGIGAALFALHPLRVESVAWAAERKDVLCGAFFLVALLLHVRHARAPSLGRYLLVVLAFALALLAKPTAVAFPLVALLVDLWLRPAAVKRGLRYDGIPLFALAGAFALFTLWVQARDGSVSSFGALPLGVRALNALSSVAVYLGQTLLPRGFAVFYPHAAMTAEHPVRALALPALGGALLLAVGAVAAFRTRRTVPAFGVGLGAFLALLLPVLGLVQVGTQAHADRYTYLPSIGLSLALAGVLARVLARTGANARLLPGLGLLVAVLLGLQARGQLATWQDTRTLFEHALALDERNHVAHLKLGEVALAEDDLTRARAEFERALVLHPAYVEALTGLAQCARASGAFAEARLWIERARTLDPDGLDVRNALGAVALELGDLVAARTELEWCLARAPSDPSVLYNLGHLATREGRPEEAEQRFLAALALDPSDAEAWGNVGTLRLGGGRLEEAAVAFERALALEPLDAIAHFNLGVLRERQGNQPAARACFARALELDPALAPARDALRRTEEGG